MYNIYYSFISHSLFKNKLDTNMTSFLLSGSLLISLFSQINIYISNSGTSFGLEIVEVSLFGIMILSTIANYIFYRKRNKRIKKYNQQKPLEVELC